MWNTTSSCAHAVGVGGCLRGLLPLTALMVLPVSDLSPLFSMLFPGDWESEVCGNSANRCVLNCDECLCLKWVIWYVCCVHAWATGETRVQVTGEQRE